MAACAGLLLLSGLARVAAAPPPDLSNLPPAATRPVDFAKDIQPIFEKSCQSCHGPEKQKGGYRLDAKEAAFKGGENYNPAIKPMNSADSPLIHFVAGLVPDMKMPGKGEPLTAGRSDCCARGLTRARSGRRTRRRSGWSTGRFSRS